MDINTAINEFVASFQRSKRSFGKLELLPIPRPVQVSLPLSDDLKTYFEIVKFDGKVLIGGFFYMRIFSPDELIEALQGWRWVMDKTGALTEDLVSWNPAWVIIAERNGDVVFVDTQSGKVYASIQGENSIVANTLSDFFVALSSAINIELDVYQSDVLVDDIEPRQEFVDDVEASTLKTLPSEASAGFMEFFFG